MKECLIFLFDGPLPIFFGLLHQESSHKRTAYGLEMGLCNLLATGSCPSKKVVNGMAQKDLLVSSFCTITAHSM